MVFRGLFGLFLLVSAIEAHQIRAPKDWNRKLSRDELWKIRNGRPPATQQDGIIQVDDMMFTEETWTFYKSRAGERGIVNNTYFRWPKDANGNTIVPYVIATNYTGVKSAITNGLAQWTNKTCVKFYEKSDPNLPVGTGDNWMVFMDPGQPGLCSSYVGNIHRGGQPVNLGTQCDTAEIVAHEVGHALGFGHEHQRADRDNYIVVFPENILQGFQYNFDKESYNNYDVPYNYLSTMHYYWDIFSSSDLATMMPKDPTLRYLMTQNNPVSHYDALTANLAFGCIDSWKAKCGTTAPTCQNYGYLSSTCKCVCPSGTSGTDCSTKTASALPQYPMNNCGGQVNNEGNYSVPNMGQARAAFTDCVWQVNPPPCSSAEITFFNFRLDNNTQYRCFFEGLGISNKSLYIPNMGPFCGTALKDGTKFTGSTLVLFFQSFIQYTSSATGFTFQVKFVRNTNCSTPAPTSSTRVVSTTPISTTRTSTPSTTTTRQPISTTTRTTTSTTTALPPSDPTKCISGKVKGANKGFWISPNYPGLAPANSRCLLLDLSYGNGYRIVFEDFKVTANSTACTNAYTIILPTWPIITSCNNQTGLSYNVSSPILYMQYQSNPTAATTGFKIIFEVY